MASEYVNPGGVNAPVDIYWADDYSTTPTVFEGDSTDAVEDGDLVFTWDDANNIGGTRFRQATSTNRPTFEQTDDQHGLGSIRCISGDFMIATGHVVQTAYTAFLVFRPINHPGGGSARILVTDGTTPTGGDLLVRWTTTNFIVDTINGDVAYNNTYAAAGLSIDGWNVLMLRVDGAADTMGIRLNGVQLLADDSSIGGLISGIEDPQIGENQLNYAIDYSAFIVFAELLDTTDRAAVESYLMTTFMGADDPPVANAGPDQTVQTGDLGYASVQLDGSASTDDGTIVSWTWSIGGNEIATGETASVLLPVGAHTITLEVEDDAAQTDTDTVLVTVQPKIRTYVHVTGQTGSEFNFDFDLMPPNVEPAYNQVRVFHISATNVVTELHPVGREDADGEFQWDFDDPDAPLAVVLDTPLVTNEELVIMRETRMDRPYARLTGAASVRAADRDLRGDQILFIAQELRETRQIADILAFTYTEPDPTFGAEFTVSDVGDGIEDTFSYAELEMLPRAAIQHDRQLVVTVNGVYQFGITADEVDLNVTLPSAPALGAVVAITRQTRIDRRWVNHVDATTFSSLVNEWDRLNVKFLIEETREFPLFDDPDVPLNNRIFPRILNEVNYSGPGDRFFFGHLPWFGDGQVIVLVNDEVLVDDFFFIDFLTFEIILDDELVAGDSITIITTTPSHAFHALPYVDPNPELEVDEEGQVTVSGNFSIVSRIVDNDDTLDAHNLLEVGQTAASADERGAILLLRSGDLGSGFPGSTVLQATIHVDHVLTNTLDNDRMSILDESWEAFTLWTQITGALITAASYPEVEGVGPQDLDATDLFQALADDPSGLAEAFIAWHEQPLPASADPGETITITPVVSFEVVYTTAAGAGESATIPLPGGSDGRSGPEQFSNIIGSWSVSASYRVSLVPRTDSTTIGAPARTAHRNSAIMRFPLDGVAGPINTARLLIPSMLFFHTDNSTGWVPSNLHVRRLANPLPTSPANTSWLWKSISGTQLWAGDASGNTDPADAFLNQDGGGTDTPDHTAVGGAEIPFPAAALNQPAGYLLSNYEVTGLETMVQDALDDGQDSLWIVLFFDAQPLPGGIDQGFASVTISVNPGSEPTLLVNQ